MSITNVAAVVLAAGSSARMERPKGLLDWGGMPLVRWQAEQLLAGGVDEVVVVTGADPEPLASALANLDRVRTVENSDHATGRSSSVRCGTAAVLESAQALYCNVDQPLPADLTAILLAAAGNNPCAAIICPTVAGERIHPVILRAALYDELLAVEEESQGLRAVLSTHGEDLATVEVDPGLRPPHFNYFAEYESAHAAAFGEGALARSERESSSGKSLEGLSSRCGANASRTLTIASNDG